MSFAVAQYRSARVETASPIQIVVQLYDGAIRFLRAAELAESQADRAKALHRAHAIVSELKTTLDASQAPELCAELVQLYDFVLDCIRTGVIQRDTERLAGAIRVMIELRSAWAELAGHGVRKAVGG